MLFALTKISKSKGLIIIKDNKVYYLTRDFKLKKINFNTKILEVIDVKAAKQFLDLINSEYFNKKKRLLVLEDISILHPQTLKLLELYNIKVQVAKISGLAISNSKSIESLSYKIYKELFNIRQLEINKIKLRPFKKYLIDKKISPTTIIQTLKKGNAKISYYYDIISAYPSAYLYELPFNLTSKQTDNFILIGKIISTKGLCLIRDSHILITDNSKKTKKYNFTSNKDKYIVLHSNLYYKLLEEGIIIKPIKKIYFEGEDTYNIYKYLLKLKEKGVSKSIINSVAFGFHMKHYKHLGLAITQTIDAIIIDILQRYKEYIIDIYVDAIFSTKPLLLNKYKVKFKDKKYKDLLFIREGLILNKKDLSTLRAVSARFYSYNDLLKQIKTSNKMIIPHNLLAIKDLRFINRLYDLYFFNI